MKALILALSLLPCAAAAAPLAARTLPAGTVLTVSDLMGEDQGDIAALLGLETRVTIFAGKPVRAPQLTTPTLIARNQIVTLAYETALMRIEVDGRALDSGSAGERIRAMNLSSRTTLSGVVAPDGTIIISNN